MLVLSALRSLVAGVFGPAVPRVAGVVGPAVPLVAGVFCPAFYQRFRPRFCWKTMWGATSWSPGFREPKRPELGDYQVKDIDWLTRDIKA